MYIYKIFVLIDSLTRHRAATQTGKAKPLNVCFKNVMRWL